MILVAVIGFGFSVQSDDNSHSKTYLAWNNPNNCICPRCNVKLRTVQKTEQQWFDCFNCRGTCRVSCAVEQPCSCCSGTGCPNGRVRNGYCVESGKCSCCQGTGTRKQLTQNACDCNVSSCKKSRETGRCGDYKIGRRYSVLECPTCGREYSGCWCDFVYCIRQGKMIKTTSHLYLTKGR